MTMTDKTSDLARNHKRSQGLLSELSNRQSDVQELRREILADLSNFAGLALLVEGYNEDTLVAVVLTRMEMTPAADGEERKPTEIDLVWAVEFLDHLDTQGFSVLRYPDAYR